MVVRYFKKNALLSLVLSSVCEEFRIMLREYFILFISIFFFRLANIRHAEVAMFNPLDSKCEESLDMCCRHPDWRDVPLEQEIELPPKIPVECLILFQNL